MEQKSETQPDQQTIDEVLNLFKSGKLSKAKIKIENYIKKFPKSFVLFNILGAVCAGQDELEVAINHHKKSVEINPDYAEGYNNLGIAFQKLGLFEEAVKNYKKTLKLKPDFSLAYNNLGVVLKSLNKLDEALLTSKKAIELDPKFADAHNNIGAILQDLGNYEEAYKFYKKAIKLKSSYSEAYYNLGILLKKLGKIEECIENFQKAVTVNQKNNRAYSNYLFNLNYLTKYDDNYYIEEAKKFGLSLKKIDDQLCIPYKYNVNPKKLTVGFVSADLRNHPVGYYLIDTLKYLKKKNIKLIAYHNSTETDDLTEKLKKHFDIWYNIEDKNDLKVINSIRENGIHILFDMSGHTKKNRLPIFVNKAAPIQVTWIGYNATTGLKEIDYIIGDQYVTPLENKNQFTENILQLPNIWSCLSKPSFEIKKENSSPALKNGFITFGSFNNLSKINDDIINTWSEILKRVENSKLFLKTKELDNLKMVENIRKKFQKNGIDAEKIITEGRSKTREEMLKKYNQIDIALDPFPYSGVTTSFESVWMGVPLYVLNGNNFYSRIGVSINKNLGMDDWIANNKKDYSTKILKLTSDFNQLSQTRKCLINKVDSSTLFDSSLFADNFNKILWKIWEKFTTK
jgi:predicted O-linked N-acetylglucosamine transferase (SPINDLY family)